MKAPDDTTDSPAAELPLEILQHLHDALVTVTALLDQASTKQGQTRTSQPPAAPT